MSGLERDVALAMVSVAALALFIYRMGLERRRRGAPAGRPAEATITWLGSYSAAFQRALDICSAMEIELVEADPNHGTILGRSGLAGLGPAPNVRIELRTQEGVTTLTLCAASQLVDVGQARRLAQRFVEIWDRMPDPF